MANRAQFIGSKYYKGILSEGVWSMHSLSFSNNLRIASLLVVVLAISGMAHSQTVVFKQPPAAPQSCPYDAKALEEKITELKNLNVQLANRAKTLEVQVAAMKVVTVRKHRTAQYCKRWNHHRCTWLVRK
jgi:hypothetical protein